MEYRVENIIKSGIEATNEEADSASTSKGPHDGDNDVANYFLNK